MRILITIGFPLAVIILGYLVSKETMLAIGLGLVIGLGIHAMRK